MAQTEKRDITRVNMNLPTDIVRRVKQYAEELGLPITQAYTVLISNALHQKETMKIVPELIETLKNLKANGELPSFDNQDY